MRSFVRTLLGLLAFAAAWQPQAARADDAFPSRVVRLVVPAASGSTTDTIARLLADKLGRTWNQTVIVENIAGGAMNVGAEHVYKAAPDGYTLMVCPPAPVSIQHLLYTDLNYDPRKFVSVALLAKIPNALVVRNELPAKDVHELITYAKANPGKLSFGSQGAGSTAHLSASELEVLTGIKMVHVPYRGALPGIGSSRSAANFSPSSPNAAFTSRLILSTTAAGVPGGATSTNQVIERKPGTPASATVGSSGTLAVRSALATARMRTLPARHCGTDVVSVSKNMSMWPAITSLSAGSAPR